MLPEEVLFDFEVILVIDVLLGGKVEVEFNVVLVFVEFVDIV
jgi:hypothetical protein